MADGFRYGYIRGSKFEQRVAQRLKRLVKDTTVLTQVTVGAAVAGGWARADIVLPEKRVLLEVKSARGKKSGALKVAGHQAMSYGMLVVARGYRGPLHVVCMNGDEHMWSKTWDGGRWELVWTERTIGWLQQLPLDDGGEHNLGLWGNAGRFHR